MPSIPGPFYISPPAQSSMSIGDTGPAAGSSSSSSTSKSTAGQKFAMPDLVSQLANLLGGVGQQAGGGLMDYLSNPVASPLFQNQLGALLNSLRPSEAQSRQALTDQFRAAGGLRSGAYGNAAGSLENDILGNREKTAANLLGQSFGPMTQALLGAIGQMNPLIQGLKMNYSDSSSNSQSQSAGGQGQAPMSVSYGPSSIGQGGYGPLNTGSGINTSSPFTGRISAGQSTNPGAQITPDLSLLDWGSTPDYYNPTPGTSNDFLGGGQQGGGFDWGDPISYY